jgi:hypothetical protein
MALEAQMAAKLLVRDDTLSGQTLHEFELEFESDNVDVRELIRSRVYQEVRDYNAGTGAHFRGLVQPKDSEADGQVFKLPKQRKLDWKEQFEQALAAFEAGRVLIIVNDKQVESLQDRVDVGSGSQVSFLKLVPLVGG